MTAPASPQQDPPQPISLAVLGAGAWGTALAAAAARCEAAPAQVILWAREPEVVDGITRNHMNGTYLPGILLSNRIHATGDLEAAAASADVLYIACPAQHLRATLEACAASLKPGARLILCAKGLERGTGLLTSQVAAEVLTRAGVDASLAVLSGPSFAADVANGLPTAVTLAAETEAAARALAPYVSGPGLRPYLSADLIGAQVGGAVKNVLAIACGIVEGKGLGDSARAALTARGFAEMTRFALALGGQIETLGGLAGLGDLILTCGSLQSRNMSLGAALGRGEALGDILAARTSVAEGVWSAPAITGEAKRLGVDMPICQAVEAVLAGTLSVDDAIDALLSRPLKAEGLH